MTRSQVSGGLPPLGWQGAGASNTLTRRSEAALAREARAAKRHQAKAREREAAEAAIANANATRNPKGAVANPNDNSKADEPNPHNQNPPHEVWMGVQVCGVWNGDAARSLAKNLFMSNFSGCLEVTKDDILDAFESSEKRSENDMAI